MTQKACQIDHDQILISNQSFNQHDFDIYLYVTYLYFPFRFFPATKTLSKLE